MRQIIALGGGGFSTDSDNLILEEYILDQTGESWPSVCFLPTASGDSDEYIVRFYSAFTRLKCLPSHLSLTNPPTADLESWLLEKNVIYVGGGNTKNMLALWSEWGLASILQKAWDKGIILAGVSAGAICWFEQCVTDSIPEKYTALPCLGFLSGSCCPSYDSEPARRSAYRQMVGSGEMLPGFALDDDAALHLIDGTILRVATSRSQAGAWFLSQGEFLNEVPLETQCLLEETPAAAPAPEPVVAADTSEPVEPELVELKV